MTSDQIVQETAGGFDEAIKTLAVRLSRRRLVRSSLIAGPSVIVLQMLGLKTAIARTLGCGDCFGVCDSCITAPCFTGQCCSPLFFCCQQFNVCCSSCSAYPSGCSHHIRINLCDNCNGFITCEGCGSCAC